MYVGPGREWRDAAPQLIQAITAELRAPGGTEELRPIQATVLDEALRGHGAFVFARAGAGKTLLAATLPVRLAALGYRRPLILTAAGMCKRTPQEPYGATGAEFRRARRHWRVAQFFELKSYSFLTRAENAEWLEQWRPDVIICDEAHALRRKDAASVPRRMRRYLEANPHVRVVAMSGTFHRSRITDFAHILHWCLRDGSPLPPDPAEVEQWSMAIDEGDLHAAHHSLRKYGCPTTDHASIKAWWSERLRRCPGVIISDDAYDGSELRVRVVHVEPGCAAEYEALRVRGERPDGYALTPDRPGADVGDSTAQSALAVAGTIWQVARQLALGFYYTFDPQPPAEWLRARKAWARFVRAVIEQGLADTELQVRHICEQGAHRVPEYETWEAIRNTFVPQRATRWLDDRALRYAQAWGSREPGIIWYEHQAVGDRLAELTGWRHFTGGGLDSNGARVDDARPEPGSIIVSRPANYTGRNLQYHWHRNLALGLANSNLIIEQQSARTHRDGQPHPWVDFEVYAGCHETGASVLNVLREAQHSRETTSLEQRWLRAAIDVVGGVPEDSWAWRTARPNEKIVRDGLAHAPAAY